MLSLPPKHQGSRYGQTMTLIAIRARSVFAGLLLPAASTHCSLQVLSIQRATIRIKPLVVSLRDSVEGTRTGTLTKGRPSRGCEPAHGRGRSEPQRAWELGRAP